MLRLVFTFKYQILNLSSITIMILTKIEATSVVQSSCCDPILFHFLDSIFAPKDIDCDEMDDAEREIEAFKRFCFDSVPLQQKTKVNFDVKNIAFKKK